MERRRRRPAATMLMLAMFVSVALASNVEPRTDYEGWKVLEVHLEGDDIDSRTLNKLHGMEEPAYLEILRTRRDKGLAEVAVSPGALEDLREQQQRNEITFSTVINDLRKTLDSDAPSLRASPLVRGAATYDRYMNVDEILAHLEELPKQYPDKVTLKKVGDSGENRPIYLVSVTTDTNRNVVKPIIFVDGGIHAREWISPAAALNIIGRLLESPSLTRNIEWQIIPLVNPDGYAYSWTKDRLWRKNRSNTSWRCTGTDLNRNFGYHWGESGSSSYACSTIYRGSKPFSEPESRALRDAMVPVKDRIEAYVTIHSYGQYILHPWGYTTKKDRYNDGQLFSVGQGIARSIKRNDGTVFTVGSAAKLLYPAAGASDDWAAGELKIPLVYTLELRDEGAGGFVLPEHMIRPAINDAWLAMKYLGKQQLRKDGFRLEVDTATAPAEPRTQSPVDMDVEESVTQAIFVEAPVLREPIMREPIFREPIFREPVNTESVNVEVVNKGPVFVRPTFARPAQRAPVRRRWYDDSSEEDSSSSEESSSEEDSDEDRK